MSLYQVRRDEGKFVQLDHAKRRRDREMAEIATAAARVGLSKQECEARALELESLLPELAPNLDKLKASDWALLLRDVEAVAVKIITLKVYFPGADVGKIVAKSPKVLLRSVEVLKEDAVQVRSMFGTRVHNLDAVVETCPDLLSPRQAALSIHNLQRWFPGKDVYKLLETDPTLLQNIEEATLQADPTYGLETTEELRGWLFMSLGAVLGLEQQQARLQQVEEVWSDLVRRHTEPQRHYHTLAHLHAMKLWLTEAFACSGTCRRAHGALQLELSSHHTTASLPTSSEVPPVVVLSVLYHDAVYDPQGAAGDNERQSAELARRHLGALGVPRAVVEAVAANVLATIRHEPLTTAGQQHHEQAWQMLFLDADLSVLAAQPPHMYEAYARAIRREYAHVDEPAFRAGRAAVLQRLMERPSLYFTTHARDCLSMEAHARSNMTAERQALLGPT